MSIPNSYPPRHAQWSCPVPVIKLYIGDVVQTRKTHPCGSDQWKLERLGADVGIRCQGCGRYVLMQRVKFERRIKKFVTRPPEAEGRE